jgi:N-acetylglucosaminyldiphosphoundecaprenol N-acetyl-beta-D-mannosaminyltransferase
MTLARIDVLGCSLDPVTGKETLQRAFSWTESGARTSHNIVTVNVAILMMSRADDRLQQAIRSADLAVVDGKPLVWAARWLGTPVPEKVAGVDLMQDLLQAGNDRGLRVFLLGTTQERLEALGKVIRARYPNVVICGSRNGYFQDSDHASVTTQIREAHADLLLVGMPAPFKEIWCEEHRKDLATPVILGVGGAFDVMAGYVPRAPRFIQEAGLEWAWRLTMEPRKLWKRYLLTNTGFIALLARTLLTQRWIRGRVRFAGDP